MDINFKDIKLFDGMTFEDLIKEIYSKNKKKSIDFENILKGLVKVLGEDPTSMAILMPMLSEYSDILIKNDDSLIKLAGIIQRFHAKSATQDANSKNEFYFSQEEIDKFLKPAQEMPIEIISLEKNEDKIEQ